MAEAAPGRVLVLDVLRIVDQSVDPVGAYPLVQLGTRGVQILGRAGGGGA